MHVIARPRINAAIQRHPSAANWLRAWWALATKAKWQSLHDVRQDYPRTDRVGRCLIFDACGNNFRLIVGVAYATKNRGGTLFVKHFLTHTEYDKDDWEKDCC